MFNFEKLRVYQEAIMFVDHIYRLTEKWPRSELFSLIDQLRRAAISIVLNIAESTSRTKKDFRHFLDIARGSCYEYVAILTIAKKRSYISLEEYNQHYEYCNKIARMISALKSSIK